MRISREKTSLSSKRWAKYAAAGAAGAVAALGPQTNVDADFTWVDVGTFLTDNNIGDGYFDQFGPYTLGGAGASFVMLNAQSEVGPGVGQMAMFGLGNLQVTGINNGGYLYPSNLAYGQVIDSALDFNLPSGSANRQDMAWGSGYGNSQFLNAGTSYIGFTFDLGGGAQYGFIEVEMDGAPVNTGTLVGYGYGMVGEAVFAGQRPSIVPEPSALGVLALGAFGVAAWRRKRSA